MKVVVLFFGLCLVVVQALTKDELASEWQLYKKIHGKTYGVEEDARRFNIYLENKQKMSEHNQKYVNGEVSFRVGVNRFTDKLESEVKALNGAKGVARKIGKPYVDDGKAVPSTVDWRNKGVVTPVKDQGDCGSCWSFSTTGSLEGQHALKKGKLVSLSEQNLIDCSSNYHNRGCVEGMPDRSFNYIQENGGIDTEESYPYLGKEGKCVYNSSNAGATVTGHVDLFSGDEDALMNAVAKIGPISVTIDARNWTFHHYAGGVYSEPACSSVEFDHCVLVVGYGTENGKDYWLVKNSWGANWGEEGYIKMSRNTNNQCGIATHASYPLVQNPDLI